MSELARLAGSVVCAGLPGDVLADGERRLLEDLRPGGILLFARNVTTPRATNSLVAAARTAAGGDMPALVCVDQEGGRVVRLRFAQFPLPSAMALGATRDEALAERAGAQLAGELLEVGASVNFAPVLDLALEPRNTVIGARSLGDDPYRAGALGAALVRGMQGHGVVATVKHFPGHGSTVLDSHTALPVVGTDEATLRGRDLVPFRAALDAGARAVMTAHVVVKALDARSPATLSRAVLGGLLRDELAFDGVCFTDCLTMDAIARGVGTARGAALALAAGADAVVISNDLVLANEARDEIVRAVGARELSLPRLEEAAERVRRLRVWAAQTRGGPEPEASVSLQLAQAAVTVVRGDARLAPQHPVTVVSFEGNSSDGASDVRSERPSLSLALRRRRLRSEVMRVPLEPSAAMLDMLLEVVATQGERNVVAVARRAHLYPAQRRALGALFELVPGAVAVSALEPFDVPALCGARSVVCTYGDDEAAIEALADVLAGRRVATGRLPVALAHSPYA